MPCSACSLLQSVSHFFYIAKRPTNYKFVRYLLLNFLWLRRLYFERLRALLPLQVLLSTSCLALSWPDWLSHACIGVGNEGLGVLKDHVPVVVEHAHRCFEVGKLVWIHLPDLLISNFPLQDQLVQLFCRRML